MHLWLVCGLTQRYTIQSSTRALKLSSSCVDFVRTAKAVSHVSHKPLRFFVSIFISVSVFIQYRTIPFAVFVLLRTYRNYRVGVIEINESRWPFSYKKKSSGDSKSSSLYIV